MGDVKPQEAGVASGIVNTSFMMGGALGLSVLAAIATARTNALGGADDVAALTGGYHLAFLIGSVFAAAAATIGALLIRDAPHAIGHGEAADTASDEAEAVAA